MTDVPQGGSDAGKATLRRPTTGGSTRMATCKLLALDDDWRTIFDFVFAQPGWLLHEADPPGTELPRVFSSTRAIVKARLLSGSHASFALHTPEMCGDVHARRIHFAAGKTRDGATFRYELAGWGLVRIHRGVLRTNGELTGANIGHNSEKRAKVWAASAPDEGDPAGWDWKVVNRVAGRLVRHITKLSTKREGWLHLPHAARALEAGSITLRPYG